jgi:hypothetical protein
MVKKQLPWNCNTRKCCLCAAEDWVSHKVIAFPPKKCTMLQNLEFLIDHHRYSVISIKPMPVAKFQHYHCFFERYLSNPRKFSSNFLVSSMKSKSYTSSWTLGVSHI